MKIKDSFEAMFGFIFTQPIHKSLRQMRLIAVGVILVSVDIMYRLVFILETTSSLSPSQAYAAIATLAAAVLASIWKGISNLSESHKADDE